MGTRTHRRASVAGLGAGTLLVLAGFGVAGAGTAAALPALPASRPATAVSAAAVRATVVTVVEKEFSITLPRRTFKAGKYTFKVTNQGRFMHDLVINGPGVNKKATPMLMSGRSGTLSVTLKRGTYELWCSVKGHKESGMDLKIKVT